MILQLRKNCNGKAEIDEKRNIIKDRKSWKKYVNDTNKQNKFVVFYFLI